MQIFIMLILFTTLFTMTTSTMSIGELTTNYLTNPMGLDVIPRFSWTLFSSSTASQSSYRLQISLKEDDFEKALMFDSGVVKSNKNFLNTPSNLIALKASTDYFWRVEATSEDGNSSGFSKVSRFSTGLMDKWPEDATWITGGITNKLLRTTFSSSKSFKQAKLYISGIGYHEVYLNGQKVGDHKLDSPWSDNNKRNYYVSHDVTSFLVDGENAIGVMLGNGWYSCGDPANPTTQPGCVNDPPQVIATLIVDGDVSNPVVSTSASSWTVSSGPITYDSLYNGERYDARLEQDGWSTTAFDDSTWTKAADASNYSASKNGKLVSAMFELIRIISSRDYVTVNSPSPGMSVYDFGQNMAGILRIENLNCNRGDVITLRHSELLMHPPYVVSIFIRKTIPLKQKLTLQVRSSQRLDLRRKSSKCSSDRYVHM